MKGKLYKGEFLLCLLFLVISVTSIFFSIYMVRSYNIEILSQGLYSKNAKHITVDSDENILSEIKNGSLYIESENINFDVRYVYASGKTNRPQIISGRFFDIADFIEQNKVAVIGQNLESLCVIENDSKNKYIEVNGVKYSVIGIMGNEIASKLDNTCFVAMSKEVSIKDEVIIVDSLNSKSVEQIITDVKEIVGADNVEVLNVPIKGITNWMNTEINSVFFYFVILLLFAFNSIALTSYWVQKRMQHIAVMRLCGYSNYRIVLFIAFRYLRCLFGGYVVGLILSIPYLFFVKYSSFETSITVIVFTLIILLLFGLVISIFPAYSACTKDVMPILRRAEKNEI